MPRALLVCCHSRWPTSAISSTHMPSVGHSCAEILTSFGKQPKVWGRQRPWTATSTSKLYTCHHFLCSSCWETRTYSVVFASFKPLPVVLTQKYLSFVDLRILPVKDHGTSRGNCRLLHSAVPSDSGSMSQPLAALQITQDIEFRFFTVFHTRTYKSSLPGIWSIQERLQHLGLPQLNALYSACFLCGLYFITLRCPQREAGVSSSPIPKSKFPNLYQTEQTF